MSSYDATLTSSVLNVDVKRRIYSVTFDRPGAPEETVGKCYIKEDEIVTTPNHPYSGSIIKSDRWIIHMNYAQLMTLSGSAVFIDDFLRYTNDLKNEYDLNGSISTGSISVIS